MRQSPEQGQAAQDQQEQALALAVGVGSLTWLTETLALIAHTDTFVLEWSICAPLLMYLVTPSVITLTCLKLSPSQERGARAAQVALSAYVLTIALAALMIWVHDEATILGQEWRLRLSLIAPLCVALPVALMLVKGWWRCALSGWGPLKLGVVFWGLTVTTIRLPRDLALHLFNHRWAELSLSALEGGAALMWAALSWWALSALSGSSKAPPIRPLQRAMQGVVFIALSALIAGASLHGSHKPERIGVERARDVFVFILDSLRADHATAELMPSLESLKRSGLSFERASSPSIMTEVSLPRLLGMGEGAPSLPERLRAEGFETHLISDYPNTALSGLDRYHWDSIARPHPWRRYLLTSLGRYASAFMEGDSYLIGGLRGEKHPFEEPVGGGFGVVTHLRDTLERAEGAGFYLTHLATPHTPYNLPPYRAQSLEGPSLQETWAMNERFRLERGEGSEIDIVGRKQLYRLAVRAADEALEALLQEVRAHEARTQRKALVIVTSDHGEPFGEHGAVGHGRSLYEEAHHVPLVLSGEGFGRGLTSSAPASGAQLPATVEAWLGLTPSPRAAQTPLSAALDETREVLVWFPRGSVLTAGRWRLIFTEREHLLTRPKSWAHRARFELFDVYSDPHEREDLASKEPAHVQRLLEAIVASPEVHENTRNTARELILSTP